MLTQKAQDWLEVWGDRFNAPKIQDPLELKRWAERKLETTHDPILKVVLEGLISQTPMLQ